MQPTLFDNLDDCHEASEPAQTVRARVRKGAGVENRNDVYRETLPTHTGKRAEVLRYIVKMADIGATRDEIACALSLPLSSVCGRVNELLMSNPPAVRETDQRRQTRAGKSAVVLVAR